MSEFSHMDKDGHPWMVDVGEKEKTYRTAFAEGWVLMSRKVIEALLEGRNRKGDALQVAEVAGIAAVKKTPDLIPLCHPLMIDHSLVRCRLDPQRGVRITCQVRAWGVTGVEMEALTGVSAAALTVYDMCKALDKGMVIDGIKLLEKTGGKSGDWIRESLDAREPEKPANALTAEFKAGILTVSDRGSIGERPDSSGPALARMVRSLGFSVDVTAILPDEKKAIETIIKQWSDELDLHLILVTGGTGLSPRDVTPEAVLSVIDREIPGFGERMRCYSLAFTDRAVLTRGLAGTRGGTLIVSLPGSEKGAVQCLESLKSVLVHGILTLRGIEGECGSPDLDRYLK